MKRAFELGKWIYSGLLGVALVLAGLISQIQAPLSHNSVPEVVVGHENIKAHDSSTTLSTSSSQESKITSVTTQKSRFSSLAQARKEVDQALSWNEMRSFPSAVYRDFIQQLAQEEFENGQPFVLSQQRGIWKQVLGEGLKDYSRKVYRSPYFQSRSGYDLIYYELLLGSGNKAFLLAFREKTEDMQVVIGGEDSRPTRIDLYTQTGDESWRLQSFQASGEKILTQDFNPEQFYASKQAIVSLSVPLLTAGQ